MDYALITFLSLQFPQVPPPLRGRNKVGGIGAKTKSVCFHRICLFLPLFVPPILTFPLKGGREEGAVSVTSMIKGIVEFVLKLRGKIIHGKF